MKKVIALLTLLMLTGCTTSNQYGKCIGLNGKEDSKLEYEYSTGNIIWSILFIETVVVPVIVVMDELKCPVGVKK